MQKTIETRSEYKIIKFFNINGVSVRIQAFGKILDRAFFSGQIEAYQNEVDADEWAKARIDRFEDLRLELRN